VRRGPSEAGGGDDGTARRVAGGEMQALSAGPEGGACPAEQRSAGE
jgi:hypothetical protein